MYFQTEACFRIEAGHVHVGHLGATVNTDKTLMTVIAAFRRNLCKAAQAVAQEMPLVFFL